MRSLGVLSLIFVLAMPGVVCLESPVPQRVPFNDPGAPLYTGEFLGQVAVIRKGSQRYAAYTSMGDRTTFISFRRYDAQAEKWGDADRISAEGYHFNRWPHLLADDHGIVHSVWVSRDNRRKYQVMYRRLGKRGAEWSEPVAFPAGILNPAPRLAADEEGNLYLYYWSRPSQKVWGRIFFFTSSDNGGSWREVDPNYADKKGEAAGPEFLQTSEGGGILAWLDQTPGKTALVYRRFAGEGWTGPIVANERRDRSVSGLRMARLGKEIFLAWSVVRLTDGGGLHTEIWWDRSDDGGEDWQGNRLLTDLTGTPYGFEFLEDFEGPRMLWIESRQERPVLLQKMLDSPQDRPAETIWESKEAGTLGMLTTAVSETQIVIAAVYKPKDEGTRGKDLRSRILFLSKTRGESRYGVSVLESHQSDVNATAPTGLFVDPSGWVEFCFVEVKKPLFSMEPLDQAARAVWSRFRVGEGGGPVGPTPLREREVQNEKQSLDR